MFTNKIGERGRAKFTIKPTSNSNYKFYIESPYLSLASTVEGYIWPEGVNPNIKDSPYIHQFTKYYNNQYVYSCPEYIDIENNKRYYFHVYYYYNSQKIYLDEIVFRL